MSTPKFTPLVDRGVVKVTGPDATKFLQGLITNDINQLKAQKAIHAAILSPQGKILFDFFAISHDQAILLDTPRASTTALKQRLSMYKLRSNVTIEDVSQDYTVAALWGDTALPPPSHANVIYFPDPRQSEMGSRLLATLESDWSSSTREAEPSTHDDYDAHRIAQGVPEGGKDFDFGSTFPHEAMLDQLNGVSFSKGCYVGQEVVSRMQHRATARKRILPIQGEKELPPQGTEIRAGTSLIGTICTVNKMSALANLRLDRAHDARLANHDLTAQDTTITIKLPSWATFSLSAPGATDKNNHTNA